MRPTSPRRCGSASPSTSTGCHNPSEWAPGWSRRPKRECLAHQRARARFEPIDVDLDLRESPGHPDGPEATALRHESVNEVAEAFALLTQRCRDLLRRVVADRTESYKEISGALGMPVGAIGPTRSRCLDQSNT